MKILKQVILEAVNDRGFGVHSFGMEPSVDEYIKGLNAADKHAKDSAVTLLHSGRYIEGGFHEPVEHELYKGEFSAKGHGDFEGYSHSWRTDGRGNAMEFRYDKNPMFVKSPKGRTIGYVHGSGEKYFAHLPLSKNDSRISRDIKVPFEDKQTALRYVVFNHMKEHPPSILKESYNLEYTEGTIHSIEDVPGSGGAKKFVVHGNDGKPIIFNDTRQPYTITQVSPSKKVGDKVKVKHIYSGYHSLPFDQL